MSLLRKWVSDNSSIVGIKQHAMVTIITLNNVCLLVW